MEDRILRMIKGRKLAKNANYYAFTATPKNKTLEMFGEEYTTADGVTYAPFHEYTMKQAIEEKFILDVIRNYTPYQSFYEVVKKVEDDPEFDKDKAPKRIRAYLERQPETIEAKSRIIVDHFCTKVFKNIGENVVRKAPTMGWAQPQGEEETDGGYLAAAESEEIEHDGK